MTEDEEHAFCGTICHAARQLGIYGRLNDAGFVWFDPMNGMQWLISPRENKKKTLVAACESLVEVLVINQNPRNQ